MFKKVCGMVCFINFNIFLLLVEKMRTWILYRTKNYNKCVKNKLHCKRLLIFWCKSGSWILSGKTWFRIWIQVMNISLILTDSFNKKRNYFFLLFLYFNLMNHSEKWKFLIISFFHKFRFGVWEQKVFSSFDWYFALGWHPMTHFLYCWSGVKST